MANGDPAARGSPESLNYRHLLYFWVVVREGGVVRASQKLGLAQPTVSGQLRKLEQTLGDRLFTRTGRHLALTEFGQMVFRHADEIFRLGQRLAEAVQSGTPDRPLRLSIGVTAGLPKMLIYRLLAPAWQADQLLQLLCIEDKPDRLLAALAIGDLDLVLSDAPPRAPIRIKVFTRLLGVSPISFFAAPALARRLSRGFPRSLNNQPFLLPLEDSELRQSLEKWFQAKRIAPAIAAEIQDSAVVKAFGQAGMGVFAAPSVVEAEIRRSYCVSVIGNTREIIENYYAISIERRFSHPAVAAIASSALDTLLPG